MSRFHGRTALIIFPALLVSACQLEATAPMRAFDIQNVAETGVPVAVNAMLTANFPSESWCEDEGAMAIRALGSATVPIEPTSCQNAGDGTVGQFNVTTSLVRTAGAADPATVVEEVLSGDLVRFAVFPHGRHKDLLSVGIFMDVARLEAARDQLLNMPVFRQGGNTAMTNLTLTLSVTNDLPTPVKFYLKDVGAGGDLPADESVLEIPSGGSDTVTLDAVTEGELMQRGWVNFFAMTAPK